MSQSRLLFYNMNRILVNECQYFSKILGFSLLVVTGSVLASNHYSLTTNSPFMAPEVSPKAQIRNSALNPLANNQKIFSLKGVTKIGSKYKFSIYDNRTKKAQWINAGVPFNDFTITGYNEESRTVEYIWSGKKGTVQMTKVSNNTARIIARSSNQELNNYSTVNNPTAKIPSLFFEVSSKPRPRKVYYSSKNSPFGTSNPVKNYSTASKNLNSPQANNLNSVQSDSENPLKGKIHPALLRNRITPNRVNSRPHASDHIEAMEAAKRKQQGL